jgi:hypothetical protein
MIDDAATGTFRLNLPQDLLSEAQRQSKQRKEKMEVEGWRTTWLSRVSEILIGKG